VIGLSELWMPILVSAVAVFVASSLIHMVIGWHRPEFPAPPNQDALMDAMRPFNLAPGEYMMPRAASMKAMQEPEFIEKTKKGPVAILTVLPNGGTNLGKMLGQWFVFILIVGVFSAYLTGRTHGSGADSMSVMRVAGTAAFLSYAMAGWSSWIWWGRTLRSTLMATLDGLIYGLITGWIFCWLWPVA
jgi:hypothetical protein